MARDKFGIIPDDHFENEPTYPAKNVSPLSKYWVERIKEIQERKIVKVIRNKLGPIPDDHFENDHGPPPKEKAPLLDQALLDHIETVRVRHGSDKYKPGDVVGGY
jgi:hypothetical protein